MKIIVALDSFKGTLAAIKACEIVAKTIKQEIKADVVLKPMADGGEGTAEAMIAARKGEWISQKVMGPLPDMEVEAGFAWFEREREALVEMATASGITLLSKGLLNPMKTTTYGTGQLIHSTVEYGAEKILLAIGGSSTVDGGVGAAMALGWKFLDAHGKIVPLGGEGLADIKRIIRPDNLNLPPIEVLSDVDNPLCGEHGAAVIYGPQKGATPEMVEQLEKSLDHLSEIVELKLNKEIKDIPGAGAAGGIGAGAVAFMDATISLGIGEIIAYSNILGELKDADWVITGEGSFDYQSLMGKVISGICRAAKKTNTKVAVIAGQISVDERECKKHGIMSAIECKKADMSLEYALKNSESLVFEATREFTNKYLKEM
ncbi:MAG: glycerate kinase family protein [Planctomycetota bacterium]|jgi:glycerate kinase